MKKYFLTFMLLGFLSANAQVKHEVAAVGGAGMHSLKYDVLGGNNPMKFGFKAGLNYTLFFTDMWGIGVGAEFARYNNHVTLPDGLRYGVPTDDPARTDINIMMGYNEKQTLSAVNIPLTLQFNAPVGKVRFYALAGAKLGIPFKATYTATADNITRGTFDGTYYWDNASFDNYSSSGDLNVKKVSAALTGELGVKFQLSEIVWLYLGGYIDYGLNNVRKDGTQANLVDFTYNASQKPVVTDGRSVFALNNATNKANLVAFGGTLRLGFNFGGKKKEPKPVPEPLVIVERDTIVKEKEVVREVVRDIIVRDTIIKEVIKEIPQEIKQTMIKLSNTLFAFDRFNLTEEAIIELDKVVSWLKQNPDINVEIEGHTDNRGSAEYNQNLSTERAKSVYDYFVNKGVASHRLAYKGYGLIRPIADNATEAGRQQNRRVELKIIQ